VLVRSFCLGLLLGVGLLVAGCGSGQKIPTKDAAALVRNLNTVERGFKARKCKQTRPALRRLARRVDDLPSDVDRGVRSTLDGGVARLLQLFESECKQKREPKPKPEPVPEPQPVPEQQPLPEQPVPEQQPVPEPEPEPTPEPIPEPTPEPIPEPIPEPTPPGQGGGD